MHAGRAAGVRTAAAQWGPFSRAQLAIAEPDFWMKTMTELPAVVASLTD
jgi:pyrophosphatase PpaX